MCAQVLSSIGRSPAVKTICLCLMRSPPHTHTSCGPLHSPDWSFRCLTSHPCVTTFSLQCVLRIVNFGISSMKDVSAPPLPDSLPPVKKHSQHRAIDQTDESRWQQAQCEYIYMEFFHLALRNQSMCPTCAKVIWTYVELYLNLKTIIPARCALKHFHIPTLKVWQEATLMKKPAPDPDTVSFYSAWMCCSRMNGRWLATQGWIPMVHESTFSSSLLLPKSISIHLYCIKVERIIVALELQTFIAFFFLCSLFFHRWYPASVPLKRCLSWQLHSAVFKKPA